MSFATLVALRSRDIASAAKGPKVYDLFSFDHPQDGCVSVGVCDACV